MKSQLRTNIADNPEYIQGYNKIVNLIVHIAFVCNFAGVVAAFVNDIRLFAHYQTVSFSLILAGILTTYLFYFFNKLTPKKAVQLLSFLILSAVIMSNFVVINSPYLNTYILRDVIILILLIIVCSFASSIAHTIIIGVIALGLFVTIAIIAGDSFLHRRLAEIFVFIIGICGFSIIYNRLLTSLLSRLTASQKAIKELSEFKQNLVRLTIHDLKVPVNAIMNICGKDDHRDFKEIYSYANILNKELGNILNIEKLEDKKTPLNVSCVNIEELVDKSAYSFEELAAGKSIRFITEIREHGTLSCDASLICRVLVNLLGNAVKYAEINSEICLIVTSEKGSFCKIVVHNTGSYIEKEHLPLIFDKYYTVSNIQRKDFSSSGLGLAFCRLAVKAHNGSITVTSSPENGTTFTVLLPQFYLKDSTEREMHPREEMLILTDEEKKKMKEVVQKIKSIPVYKATEIIAVVNKLQDNKHKGIIGWKKLVADAVYSGNDALFNKAIGMVEDDVQ